MGLDAVLLGFNLKTISTVRVLPRIFFIFSQFVVYSMLSSNKERKNGVATFVFD